MCELKEYQFVEGKHYRVDKKTHCWIWIRATSWGRGRLRFKGIYYSAIRYILFKEERLSAKGSLVRHSCKNSLCINKKHLYIESGKEFRTKHYLYETWVAMKQRCYNIKCNNYNNYGGRGIKVCKRWRKDFKLFLKDMGDRPEGFSINRINNDGNYKASNCEWADSFTQNNNRRSRIS